MFIRVAKAHLVGTLHLLDLLDEEDENSEGERRIKLVIDELLFMLKLGPTILLVFYNVSRWILRWMWGGDGVYARTLKCIRFSTTIRLPYCSFVAEISGFELNANNGNPSQLVNEFVQQVCKKVREKPVAKCLTGCHEEGKDVAMRAFLQHPS